MIGPIGIRSEFSTFRDGLFRRQMAQRRSLFSSKFWSGSSLFSRRWPRRRKLRPLPVNARREKRRSKESLMKLEAKTERGEGKQRDGYGQHEKRARGKRRPRRRKWLDGEEREEANTIP